MTTMMMMMRYLIKLLLLRVIGNVMTVVRLMVQLPLKLVDRPSMDLFSLWMLTAHLLCRVCHIYS